MSIVLIEDREGERVSNPHYVPGTVVHFGSEPLKDKRFVTVAGKDVAKHHAKLFFAHGHFWLLNLVGLPCTVLKVSGRAVFLTTSDPACDIHRGDSFRIGSSVFIIEDLAPPQRESPRYTAQAQTVSIKEQLRASRVRLDPDGRGSPIDPLTLGTALRFSSHLFQYVLEEEIWRQAADEIGKVFARRWQDCSPGAILAATTCDPPPAGIQEAPPSTLWHATTCPLVTENGSDAPAANWSSHLGVSDGLLPVIHGLTSEEPLPSYYRWQNAASQLVDVLAFPVMCEERLAGTVILMVRWNTATPSAQVHDDHYLLGHMAQSLSLALTFLEQRMAARQFSRLHSIGSKTIESLHDECHLIERIEPVLDSINELPVRAKSANRLKELVRRAQVILRQVKAVAHTTLDFARSLHTEEASPEHWGNFQSCGQPMREWFEELQSIIADDLINVRWHYLLGEEPFWACLGQVQAALRNLQTNAQKSLVKKRSPPYQMGFSAEVRRLKELPRDEANVEYVVLTAADSGNGMPREICERLFQGRIADSDSGFGLGTQIVRRVMDHHRGLIRFAVKESVGTLIELWFPRLVHPDEIPLPEQWRTYEEIRERVGPVKQMDEQVLLELLDSLKGEALPVDQQRSSSDGRHPRREQRRNARRPSQAAQGNARPAGRPRVRGDRNGSRDGRAAEGRSG